MPELPCQPAAATSQRLDRWLCCARLVKTRTRAARLIETGAVRINAQRIKKPSHTVKVGDVATIVLRGKVAVWRIVAIGDRRGPASEARELYEVITPGLSL